MTIRWERTGHTFPLKTGRWHGHPSFLFYPSVTLRWINHAELCFNAGVQLWFRATLQGMASESCPVEGAGMSCLWGRGSNLPGHHRESTQPFPLLSWAGVSITHHLAAPGSSGVHHCPHPLTCWPPLLVLSSLPCCSFSREPGLLEQALKAYDKYWKTKQNKTKSSPIFLKRKRKKPNFFLLELFKTRIIQDTLRQIWY